MHYTVSGRAPSFISTGMAVLIAVGMHLSAVGHHGLSETQVASHTAGSAPHTEHA
jgi:hypothetical protein